MIDTVELPAPAAPPAEPPGMLLHCGGEAVTRDALFAVPTPDPTTSWFPLAHRDLVTEVESQLTGSGFEIASTVHALSHDGARYFGILQVRLPGQEVTDYAWSLFNAFTEIHKRINPHAALRRSEALHGLFDAAVGLN